MKMCIRNFLIFLLLTLFVNGQAQKTYTLISKKGVMNKKLVAGLPASLKPLAAFYSAIGGTNCMDQQCELTTALGLGNQGSDAQKKLILKYFPEDKVAIMVIGQECYQPPTSSSSFSNFKSLVFTVNGEIVQVNYELDVLNHGEVKKIIGPDIYEFKNQVYRNKKRVLYAWTNK